MTMTTKYAAMMIAVSVLVGSSAFAGSKPKGAPCLRDAECASGMCDDVINSVAGHSAECKVERKCVGEPKKTRPKIERKVKGGKGKGAAKPAATKPAPPPATKPAPTYTPAEPAEEPDVGGMCAGPEMDCFPKACPKGPEHRDTPGSCSDSCDNDRDGKLDMLDPDCQPLPTREGPGGDPSCYDGLDNDRDGLVDLRDPDCGCPGCDKKAAPKPAPAPAAAPAYPYPPTTYDPNAMSVSFVLGLDAGFTGLGVGSGTLLRSDGQSASTIYGGIGRLMLGLGFDNEHISGYVLGGVGVSPSVSEPGGSVTAAVMASLGYRVLPWLVVGGHAGINMDVLPKLRGVRTVSAPLAAEVMFVPHRNVEIPLWIGPALVWEERIASPYMLGWEIGTGIRFRLPGWSKPASSD